MPTKISLALGNPDNITRQTAWGCMTTNLSLPGFGSLLVGRRVGYLQVVICLAGLVLTCIFGIQFILWYLGNRAQLQENPDPLATLEQLWLHVRWALLGIGVFLLAWLWALGTSLTVLRKAKAAESKPVPPKLH